MLNRLKRDWLFFFLLITIASLSFLPYMNMYLYRDEWNWLYGAERFYNGDIVYKDFFEYIFPGSFFLMAFLYAIFGVKFILARMVVFTVGISAGFLIYLLSKRIKNSLWFGLLCLLFYLSMIFPSWDSFSHHILSVTISLLTLYLFCKFIESGYRRVNLVLCGLSSAMVIFFTQSIGVYVTLAGNIFLILHNVLIAKYESSTPRSSVDIKLIINQLFIYNLAIAIFFLPVLAFFYAHSALGDMVYCTFTWVVQNYKLDTALPYFMEERPIILAPLTNFNFSSVVNSLKEIFVGYFQIIGFSLTSAYIAIKTLKTKEYLKNNAHYLLLFTLIGLAIFLASLSNPRDWQIRTMSIVGYMLFFFCCFKFFKLDYIKPKSLLPNILKLSFMVMVFAFLTTDIFYDNIKNSLKFYYNRHEIQTPRGTMTADKQTRDRFNELQKIIERYTQPGEDIFAYYHITSLYFIFNRHNPTRFNTIGFYYTPEQVADVIARLKLRKPRIVFRDNFIERRSHEIKFKTFFTHEEMLDNPIENYVKQNYRLIEDTGSLKVYEIATVDG